MLTVAGSKLRQKRLLDAMQKARVGEGVAEEFAEAFGGREVSQVDELARGPDYTGDRAL